MKLQWNDLRHKGGENEVESGHLCIIVVVALSWLGILTIIAVYLGHNSGLLMTVAGIFGVIIGAVAKAIYEKKG